MKLRLGWYSKAFGTVCVVLLVGACARPLSAVPGNNGLAIVGTATAVRDTSEAKPSATLSATLSSDSAQQPGIGSPTVLSTSSPAALAPTAIPQPVTVVPRQITALDTGVVAPDMVISDLTNIERTLSSYRGQVVMLNFWASWCGHCRSEIPVLNTVYAEYRDRGFEIVAVSVGEDPVELAAFVRDNGMEFPVLADTPGSSIQTYQLKAIPTSYFLDADGVIRQVYHGAITEGELREIVESLVS